MMEYNSYIHDEIGCILQAQSIIGRLICSRSSLPQFRPAPHMYASTFSHQGAARLAQPFAASIRPPCSSTGAAGGPLPVQGHLSGRRGRCVFLICLANPDIFGHAPELNGRGEGELVVSQLMFFFVFFFYIYPARL